MLYFQAWQNIETKQKPVLVPNHSNAGELQAPNAAAKILLHFCQQWAPVVTRCETLAQVLKRF